LQLQAYVDLMLEAVILFYTVSCSSSFGYR